MPEEFEGDLAGAVFWGADLSGARFRDVNLTGATISHAWVVSVDIDALAVRADRATRFRDYLASIAASDFTRPVDVLENGTCPLQECIYTVFEEEFWHARYAQRDLAALA